MILVYSCNRIEEVEEGRNKFSPIRMLLPLSRRLAKGNRMTFLVRVAVVTVLVAVSAVGLPTTGRAADELEQGIEAARSDRLERAVALWTRAIEKDPKSYAAHVNRGSANMRLGYVFRGVMDWNRANQLAPLFAYGVDTGDFVRHASAGNPLLNFAVAVELDPDHVPAVTMIGATYQDLGLSSMAAELFRKSIDLTRNPLVKGHLDYWANSLEEEKSK